MEMVVTSECQSSSFVNAEGSGLRLASLYTTFRKYERISPYFKLIQTDHVLLRDHSLE